MSDDQVDPERFVEYRLVRVGERLRQRFERALRPHGLTAHRYSALAVLSSTPGITGAELARAILISPQAVANLLDQLEIDGLIAREGRRGRGRPASVVVTAHGARLLDLATADVERLEDATRDALGPSNVRSLRQLLTVLEAALFDDGATAHATAPRSVVDDVE